MEALLSVLKSHPGPGVLVCSLLFRVAHQLLQRLPVPTVVRQDAFRSWKWKNLSLSMVHSVLTGTWALTCAVIWPETLSNIHKFHTSLSYLLICVSTGYFVHDAGDIILTGHGRGSWEFLLHHAMVRCDLVFPVRPLHPALHCRCFDRPLRGGQQHHPALAADAEAGQRSVLLHVPHQQNRQPLHLRHVSPRHPVLPHLVHRPQLLLAGPWRILPRHHHDDEHHDGDLFLPFAPHGLLSPKQEVRGTERHAQQQLQEVSQRLTRGSGSQDYPMYLIGAETGSFCHLFTRNNNPGNNPSHRAGSSTIVWSDTVYLFCWFG